MLQQINYSPTKNNINYAFKRINYTMNSGKYSTAPKTLIKNI